VSQKGGIVTMRLQPEALGAVRIQMTIEQGVVQARFEAATPEARDLLNKHMETLRASLEAKGLSVDRLQVQLASPGHGGPGGQTGQSGSGGGQDAQRSWSHDATDGRSRGAFDHRPDGEDRQGGRGENRWSRAGAERWDDDGPDSGRRASVVRVGLDAVA
jgi:flagellar hook-length control protein FliK